MKKKVAILKWVQSLDNADSFKCWVSFSVIDSALIGTPRERPSKHSIEVVMTDILMANWNIPGALDLVITEEMPKVALQIFEEHLMVELKKNQPLESELKPIFISTKNYPKNCPYNIDNILYPNKTSFEVEIEGPLIQQDISNVHKNIIDLIKRMDNALENNDYLLVLSTSANIFETLAKDIVNTPTIQDQTLGSFFDRYRIDSSLPDEILNYIQSIYRNRSATPLAAHGSTRTPPVILRREAVTLSEMTKAFVNIECKLAIR